MVVLLAIPAALFILVLVAGQATQLDRTRGRRRVATAPVRTKPPTKFSKDPVGWLVDQLRYRIWLRRGLSLGSVALILVALGMVGYPFYTNIVQSRIQSRLDRQLASPELRQAYEQRRVQDGDALTRLQIPSLDVDVVVVEGTGSDALRAGAGHYKATPYPCENGNVAIAGHRTTYGRPFADLDLLDVGAEVILDTPRGSCIYRVTQTPAPGQPMDERGGAFIVGPTDTWVVAPTPTPTLTLTTCHPKGSAAKRLVIQAGLVTGQANAPPAPGGT